MIRNEEGGYAGGIGHSGSESSKDATKRISGVQANRIYDMVSGMAHRGVTAREVERALKVGHGSASGGLTRLHRAGYIVRLTQRRDNQQVYVAEAFSAGREQSPYRPNIAYREGYKKPMALESQLTPEPHEQVEEFLKSKGATGYEAECFLHWFPEVVELLRG